MTIRWIAVALLTLLLQVMALPAQADDDERDDPPARAARLTALAGNIGIKSAGESDWSPADTNRPLTTGDALDLASDARAEIDFGGATVRLDGDSQAHLDRLDDNVARVDVRSGTASLDIHDVDAGSAYELRTPTIAFAPSGEGSFRVDVDHNGVTTLTLREGDGTVYGNNGAHYDVHSNQSYRFEDDDLRNVVGQPRPERDNFDRWVAEREGRFDESPSRQYVAEGVAGAADLDNYGRWEVADEYGPVWYPTTVVVDDWAPYRYGRWAFVQPWGWTWIDDAPWGYAPFHYGRWAQYHNRWCWVPGPRYVRPVYSPALVGFVGGPSLVVSIHSGPPVGWFPLGPRDVYCPPYRHSRNYFTRVNVTNVTINRTVINNTYEDVHERHRGDRVNYTYRNNNNATTVASRDDFERGHRLGNNRLRVSNDQLTHASLTTNLANHLTPPRGNRDDRPGNWDDRRGNGRNDGADRPNRSGFGNIAEDRVNRGNDRNDAGDHPNRGPARDDDHPDRGNAHSDVAERPNRSGFGSVVEDHVNRGNDRGDADERPNRNNPRNDASDRPDRGNPRNDAADRPDRGNPRNDAGDRPDRGNPRDDGNRPDRGNPRNDFSGDDDRGNGGFGNRYGTTGRSNNGGGNRSRDDRPIAQPTVPPPDFQPSPSRNADNGPGRSNIDDIARDQMRRGRVTPSEPDGVRYNNPSPASEPRVIRSEPMPSRSVPQGVPRGQPESMPSRSMPPPQPPPSMNRGGDRGNNGQVRAYQPPPPPQPPRGGGNGGGGRGGNDDRPNRGPNNGNNNRDKRDRE